jgi:parvulin-like peptidyl-prolyl isomerase
MKNLKLLIIAVVLVAVALMMNSGGDAPRAFAPIDLVEAEELDKVREVELKSSQSAIVLKRVDDEWRLPGYHDLPVDLNRLEELFQKLSSSKIVELVSENKQKHADLGVSAEAEGMALNPDTSLINLKDAQAKLVKGLYLGKGRQARQVDGSQGFGFAGQYVRYAGDNRVYLLSNYMGFDKNLKNWVSKVLLKIEPARISQVTWSYPDDTTFALERSSASDSFVFSDLKENQQTKSAIADLAVRFVANLTFDQVIATDSPELHPGLATASEVVFNCFDGLKLNFKIGSGTVDVPGAAKQQVLWLNAEYSGNKPEVDKLAKEIQKNAKKLVYGFREGRLRAVKVKAADLVEKKPEPAAENATATAEMKNEQVAASHILLAYKGAERSTAERSEEEAKKLAQEILLKIKNGADFAELAKEHSDCPSGKAKGGSLGDFGRGVMAKKFEETAFNLEVGKISEVVKTPFGYHIIRRDK